MTLINRTTFKKQIHISGPETPTRSTVRYSAVRFGLEEPFRSTAETFWILDTQNNLQNVYILTEGPPGMLLPGKFLFLGACK